MVKFLIIILFVILIGNPLTTGYFDAPTGERVWWNWFGASLGVIDSNGSCVWNNGEPKSCSLQEFSMMLFLIH